MPPQLVVSCSDAELVAGIEAAEHAMRDPRSAGQRNADGFAALLDLALDSDQMPRVGGQRPHLTVTIDFADLQRGLGFTTDHGMPGTVESTERSITAENVRRIACDSEVLPMILDGDGLPLDVGRSKRTAPVHLRAALLQRDGVCAFPGCDRPPGTPDAHHIHHWIDGGTTELSNMVMLCGHHHRTVHNQRWEIDRRDDRPVFIPPTTVDFRRTPRPGGKARQLDLSITRAVAGLRPG
ncbi:HNH endonuclease signature motif containing protein [Saccharopolyspora soli]|uniref:HNH endonuclease signature motif containing protein n=1 Tax=Saccharopolyspora soli TaxID=2926618 RepID=UPI001F57C509|nr:HNH endonuclease signature motif containing protein [Saccharopolyspora soli]